MNQQDANAMLKEHKLWLDSNGTAGKRIDAFGMDLSRLDLREADFRKADMRSTNFSFANLFLAKFDGADLRLSDLDRADIRGACFCEADLQNVNFDYSSLQLCGFGLYMNIDDKTAIQILYHLVQNVLYSKNTSEPIKQLLGSKQIVAVANRFHRAKDIGLLNEYEVKDEK